MPASFTYQGDELALFQHAKNWKNYFSSIIKPFIKGDVAEVGAGIGSTTLLLYNTEATNWLLLEPDENMSALLRQKIQSKELPEICQVQTGTLRDVKQLFDTIIYIDVLEHIEQDEAEMKQATALLKPGGHIIVLSPAFGFLYSPFDKAIGHYRRYNKKMLRKLTQPGIELVHNRYYDSVGYFAGLANKLLLRKKYPTQKQVLLWDRWMVPVSKVTDLLFFHAFGKSIIGVWKKQNHS